WGEIDGQPHLATASYDRTVRVWDPVSGDTTRILEGHTHWVRGVGSGEIDSQPRLATASDDRTVRVWDPVSGETVRLPILRPINSIAWAGDCLAVGTDRSLLAVDCSLMAVGQSR
ncbi:MAG: hypothetical protein GY925_25420, partial [Actinomycetia bacterium]|nr:hypothetical protein [Actinomycetes bacterium]